MLRSARFDRIVKKKSRSLSLTKYNGGNNDGDPPLSIPNREVKPISADGTAKPSGRVGSADGTAKPSGRVGSRQFIKSVVDRVLSTALFCFMKPNEIRRNRSIADTAGYRSPYG